MLRVFLRYNIQSGEIPWIIAISEANLLTLLTLPKRPNHSLLLVRAK